MARPKVFVSSTFYDLKYIRSSLDLFIESLGFDSILSEKGNIPYSHDKPLDESCYREVANADIFVLIIGGRYGSEISETRLINDAQELDNLPKYYESVTKREYENAFEKNIPIYILIEKNVYVEYHTYLKNKDNNINYVSVDSVNVFKFIEEIVNSNINNAIYSFERFSEIENWLREQWAGQFRDMLNLKSQNMQLSTLTAQVNELKEISQTLKTFLETILSKIEPNNPENLVIIQQEEERLHDAKLEIKFHEDSLTKYLNHKFDISSNKLRDSLIQNDNYNSFNEDIISKLQTTQDIINFNKLSTREAFKKDLNRLRALLSLLAYE